MSSSDRAFDAIRAPGTAPLRRYHGTRCRIARPRSGLRGTAILFSFGDATALGRFRAERGHRQP